MPENYLATVRRESLAIAEDALVEDETGRKREMRPADVDAVLAQAARNPDGSYRVVASKALPGKPLGPFRYYGTRPDDPNDIVRARTPSRAAGTLGLCRLAQPR